MNKRNIFGAVAITCAVMLLSTGFGSASKTTTIQTYKQELLQVKQATDQLREIYKTQGFAGLNMTNNTKAQLVRVLALVAVNGLGLFLIWKLRGLKSLKTLIAGILIGFDAAVIPAIILNIQRQPQNETNSTLG